MKRLFILKLGSTWPETARRLGDFEHWTAQSLGKLESPNEVVDVEHGALLPDYDKCAGVIMTGSHAMVTDDLPWSVKTEEWLLGAMEEQIPILGVCYGHQLLARAAGGHVGYHPAGREIGTVEIQTQPASRDDPLFRDVPAVFLAHVTHAQSVLKLPDDAIHLAGNAYEPNQAFRLGQCAWGVQFHPEYDKVIMREYIDGLAEQLSAPGRDVELLSREVTDTPIAKGIPQRFGEFVSKQSG